MTAKVRYPVIGAEQTPGGKWRATCVACKEWRGERRALPSAAYLEGREHQESVHGGERRT